MNNEMTSKHTSGEWDYSEHLTASENHKGFMLYRSASPGTVIAEVMPIDQDGLEGGANARLMAAAPDLYEAAKTLLAIDSSESVMEEIALLPKRMQTQVVKEHNAKYKAALASLQAATAKAEGRS